MILKRGMIGVEVGQLIKDLITVGFSPDAGSGNNFNGDVEKAVEAFQSQQIGPDLLPLVVDGEVGPLTRWALDVALGKTPVPALQNQPMRTINAVPAGGSVSGWKALQIAIRELKAGAGEEGADNAGNDVMRYHAVTHAKKGDSWCASFVSYCFDEGNPGAMPFTPTAGARDLLGKFKNKGWDYKASVNTPPAPGDIVVWWRVSLKGWQGHIGIVADYADGIVTTIEGNRGSFPAKVRSFSYTLGRIDKLLGFGRAVP